MFKDSIQSLFPEKKKPLEEVPVEVSTTSQSNCHEDAFKLIPEVIAIVNSNSQLLYLNPEAESLLNQKLRSVMGRAYNQVFELLNSNTKRPIQNFIDILSKNNEDTITRDCLLQLDENQYFPIKLTVKFLRESSEGDIHYLLVIKNMTEKRALELKLSDLETYDSLTRFLNRNSFDASVKQLIDNAHKHEAKHILAFFSIDQFQIINDSLGHAGGDSLIKAMSGIVNRHARNKIDIVGRVGDHQFAVAFTDCKISQAVSVIKIILDDAENYKFTSRGQSYSITMSAGFVLVDGASTSSTRALSEANTACSLATRKGGNNVCVYRAENGDLQKLEGNGEWVLILKKALKQNRFRMFAQPIHSLAKDEYDKPFHHYELLLRLSDDKGTPISPDEFISAAEYYSMMPQIDRWVVSNVLKQLKTIPEQTPQPVFAINLSGQSLNDPSFLSFVQDEVASSEVDPKMLCFEITEQVAVEDLTLVNNFISSLRALGASFSLDDFGTGVSTYSYLKSLDLDYLKIDGSFVKNIDKDEVSKAMVQSISQVGHTMKLKVIAEYVENNEILELLRNMGIEYGQGYHIARPGPLENVLKEHMR